MIMPALSPLSDQALSAAYSQLRRGLLSTIRRQVRDPQLAEDLLQDVFVKATRALRVGRAPGNLPGWLHQVVRTTVADHYRGLRLDVQSLEHEPAAEEATDEAAFQALATCLQPLAAQLPPLYRDALMAADFQGQRLASVATQHGVTLSAIKSRVSRARSLLKQRLLSCCAQACEAAGRFEGPRLATDCACKPTGCERPPPVTEPVRPARPSRIKPLSSGA